MISWTLFHHNVDSCTVRAISQASSVHQVCQKVTPGSFYITGWKRLVVVGCFLMASSPRLTCVTTGLGAVPFLVVLQPSATKLPKSEAQRWVKYGLLEKDNYEFVAQCCTAVSETYWYPHRLKIDVKDHHSILVSVGSTRSCKPGVYNTYEIKRHTCWCKYMRMHLELFRMHIIKATTENISSVYYFEMSQFQVKPGPMGIGLAVANVGDPAGDDKELRCHLALLCLGKAVALWHMRYMIIYVI